MLFEIDIFTYEIDSFFCFVFYFIYTNVEANCRLSLEHQFNLS